MKTKRAIGEEPSVVGFDRIQLVRSSVWRGSAFHFQPLPEICKPYRSRPDPWRKFIDLWITLPKWFTFQGDLRTVTEVQATTRFWLASPTRSISFVNAILELFSFDMNLTFVLPGCQFSPNSAHGILSFKRRIFFSSYLQPVTGFARFLKLGYTKIPVSLIDFSLASTSVPFW